MCYTIRSKHTVFNEYILFVADRIPTEVSSPIKWDISSTDDPWDATKFSDIYQAEHYLDTQGLSLLDYEIIILEDE